MGKIFSKCSFKSSSPNDVNSHSTAYSQHELDKSNSMNILKKLHSNSSTSNTTASATVDNNKTKFKLIHNFSEFENVLYVNSAQNDTCIFGDENYTLMLYDYHKKKDIKKWKGHEKDITKVLYCPKINAYLSASRDKSVKLWTVNQPACQLDMSTGHSLVINGLAVNPDNTFVISGSRDNNLNLWDLQTGKLLLTSHISRNLVTDLHWSNDNKLLVQSSEDKELRLWDPMSLKLVFSFPKKQYIQASCYFSNDNNYAISSSNGFQGNGCEISLWDLRKRALIHEFLGHEQTVSCAKFIQSSKLIASCSHDSTVCLWDVTTLKRIDSSYIGGTLTSISEASNGTLLVSSLTSGIHVFERPNV